MARLLLFTCAKNPCAWKGRQSPVNCLKQCMKDVNATCWHEMKPCIHIATKCLKFSSGLAWLLSGKSKNPLAMICHQAPAFISLVKRSASCRCVGIQCNGGRQGLSGVGSPPAWCRANHWCRASRKKIWRRPARSTARRFSVGALGTPSRCRWSYKLLQVCDASAKVRTCHSHLQKRAYLEQRREIDIAGKVQTQLPRYMPSSLRQRWIDKLFDYPWISNQWCWKIPLPSENACFSVINTKTT